MATRTIGRREGAPLERADELAELDAALAAVIAGSGRIVVIEAAAGLGKTHLLGAGTRAGRAAGMTVLRARGGELERQFPFGVALQLFEPYLAAAAPEERSRVLGGAAAHAAPVLSGRELPAEPSDGAPSFSLLHGLHWVAANIAARSPLLIVVDDAHAADDASLRVLLYLAQRIEDLPIALLLAARPEGADALSALTTHALTQRLRLGALSDAAIAAIVRAELPDADDVFCAACARSTGGNPFFAHELLVDLKGAGMPPTREHAAEVAGLGPATIARTLGTRLEPLAPGAMALARALAVFGMTAPLLQTAALAGLDGGTARAAADALAAADVLHPLAEPRFVHPIVRQAIYRAIPAAERAQLHLEAADLLRGDRAGGVERAAPHLLQTLPSGVPWVVPVLHDAARHALEEGAPELAASFLLRVLDEQPEVAERAAALIDLGRAEALAGRVTALDRLHAAVELLEGPEQRARALAQLGQALASAGQNAAAASAFDEGLETLGDADVELADQLMAGYLGASRFDVRTREAALTRFAALLSGSSEVSTPAQRELLAHRAFEESLVGAESHERVCELVDHALGGDRLLRQVTCDSAAYVGVIATLVYCDALERVEEVTNAGLEDAYDRGSVVGVATMTALRGFGRYLAGETVRALADLEADPGHARVLPIVRPLAHGVTALCRLERAELDEAAAVLDAAEQDGLEHMGSFTFVLLGRGRLAMQRGAPADALELLLGCERRLTAVGVRNPAVLPWRTDAVIAAMKINRVAQARELSEEGLRRARTFGAPRALGVALRGAGLATGGDAGLALLEESVAVLAGSPSRLEHARALVALGAARRRAGLQAAARETLRDALDLAFRTGADGLLALARSELLAAGARPRRIEQRGAGALTPSELRIAELATQGLTNREVAQAVFISTKTVEFHLRNAYAKLGIASRHELGAALAEAG
jgi:DNA-binding CsgD family transcriptional regulator